MISRKTKKKLLGSEQGAYIPLKRDKNKSVRLTIDIGRFNDEQTHHILQIHRSTIHDTRQVGEEVSVGGGLGLETVRIIEGVRGGGNRLTWFVGTRNIR